MRTTARCLCSAAAGAIVTFFALCPSSAPVVPGRAAWGQQTKSSASKTTGGTLQAVRNVKVDDSNVDAIYANFVRVTATPEEVLTDYALNTQPFAAGEQSVRVLRRLVLNFYTAKRLLTALQTTIERHELTFGPIELDVRKRAMNTENR